MSLHTGIVKSIRPIVAEDNSYAFIAFDLGMHNGKTLACQVWNSTPELYEHLFSNGDALIHHKVQVKASSYSAGSYKAKNGTEKEQLRMRVVGLSDLGLPQEADELTGVVRGARHIQDKDGKYEFLSFDIVTVMGVTYACQMWPDDPQFVPLASTLPSLVSHRVTVNLLDWSFSRREYQGKMTMQVRFRIGNLRDLGLMQED